MPVPRPGSPQSARTSSCRDCEIILRMMARWIRLGAIEAFDFRAAYSALAAAQSSLARQAPNTPRDRKSTRLNSSHTVISYAVFCLKKKKYKDTIHKNTTVSTHLTTCHVD